ncbi:phage holin family protein [Mycobacterium avium]|uniref:phage holin family protein n=1 Tax=Mycobacterium avium TaxID=1764 RepID=UPI0007C7CED1|nr:phage holin family protein [Mycobacterium avium]
MLIIALVLALIGLVALVFAVVTSNELVAWVCIAASVVGVVLLILDALRERQQRDLGGDEAHEDADEDADEAGADEDDFVDYPEDAPTESTADATESTEATEPSDQSDQSGQAGRSEESAVPADGRGDEATH